jgi:hypothetical protein
MERKGSILYGNGNFFRKRRRFGSSTLAGWLAGSGMKRNGGWDGLKIGERGSKDGMVSE